MVSYQALELITGVLAAAIGVMQQRIGPAVSPDGHHQGHGRPFYDRDHMPNKD
jgi:hypothetical protein